MPGHDHAHQAEGDLDGDLPEVGEYRLVIRRAEHTRADQHDDSEGTQRKWPGRRSDTRTPQAVPPHGHDATLPALRERYGPKCHSGSYRMTR